MGVGFLGEGDPMQEGHLARSYYRSHLHKEGKGLVNLSRILGIIT